MRGYHAMGWAYVSAELQLCRALSLRELKYPLLLLPQLQRIASVRSRIVSVCAAARDPFDIGRSRHQKSDIRGWSAVPQRHTGGEQHT